MPRGLITIDEDRCKGCGLCVDACPAHVLQLLEDRFNAKGYHPIHALRAEDCTGCARCAIICPDVVFTVYRRKRPQGDRLRLLEGAQEAAH
jgi:2-oxoglutarate ferredoxin oxidoreductase subunit delta